MCLCKLTEKTIAMFAQLEFTGIQVFWLIAGLILLLLAFIRGMRHYLQTRPAASGKPWSVFRLSGIFLGVGLIFSLTSIVVLFSWTISERFNDLGDTIFLLDEEILIEPPRSQAPPPPPPPPPPPVIQEVPNTVVLDEDQPSFLDQSVDADAYVVAEKAKAAPTTAAPPPPPPPPPKTEAPEIFRVVEEMPRFPGCEDQPDMNSKRSCAEQKLIEFIYSNVAYPKVARENNVEGTVVIQFVVDVDGCVKNAVIVRDIGGGCGQEALRVVSKMDEMPEKWIPGKQRGKAVPVLLNLPIRFKLEQL